MSPRKSCSSQYSIFHPDDWKMLVKKFPEALDDVDMLKIIDQKLKDVEKARIENGVFCEVLIADRTLVF